ncbi:MAG: sigma-70 family RNA polymerase sigma factor [Sandaracinaceae bacterium]|nr:sigma-70 family RNA polymerase sigma factor [Sandaracinaceae bacterium]
MSDETQALDRMMARLADGDRSVFHDVFRAIEPPIARLADHLLKNEADALDATQNALLKIFERAPIDYDRARPALPWVLAIAGWECRTLLRRRARNREFAIPHDPVAEEDTPETILDRRALVEATLEAIDGLREIDRETIFAIYEDAEPAIHPAAFRKRKERARTRLRERLRRLYGFD